MFWKSEDDFPTFVFSPKLIQHLDGVAVAEVSFLASSCEEEVSSRTTHGSPPKLPKTCPDVKWPESDLPMF